MQARERPPNLTDEEEADLVQLARRQIESASAEARILAKYASRAALAKQLWSVVAAFVASIVLGTTYVFTLKADIAQNSRDLASLRTEVAALRADLREELSNARDVSREVGLRVRSLELEMKDKANR